MTKQVIRSIGGRVLYECEADSLRQAVAQAVAKRVNLHSADLRDADLRDADLRGAYLNGADLRVATIDWQSHDLVAELLRQHAGDDVQKLMVAGLVLISRDWCWKQFLAIEHEQRQWAIDTLRQYVREGDEAPEVLRQGT